jgi:hypothetical protein
MSSGEGDLVAAAGRGLRRVRDLTFGGRVGLALFLASLCWFGLTWRLGFFITDTYAVANTLVNVASGHLYIADIEYSLTLGSQPGLHSHGGRVYGRNYGQVYLSLPAYLLLNAVSVVADLRITVSGAFSLALLGACHQAGGVLDRRPLAVVIGSALAAMSFALSLWWAATVPTRWTGLLALQVTSMLASAALGVVLYRLGTALYDRRAGIALGVAVVVASPIGFWASIPKRHALTAALAALTVACFYASRTRTDRSGRAARAGAYLAAGFATAVHSVEGFVLLALLLPVDLLTAPANGRRDLGLVAAALIVGLLPFLLTNTLISGNPLIAPRWLDSFAGGTIGPDGVVQPPTGEADGTTTTVPDGDTETTATSNGTAETTTAPSGSDSTTAPPEPGDSSGPLDSVEAVLSTVLAGINLAVGYASESLHTALDADRLYHVFVRSGRIPGLRYAKNGEAVVELTLIESMPIAAGVVAGVGAVGSWVNKRMRTWLRAAASTPRRALARLWRHRTDPVAGTDLLVAGYLTAFTLVYLPRLPLFSQITVRYLVPTVPLWLYLLARIDRVRQPVTTAWRATASAYVAGVVVGSALLVAVLSALNPALGEALQFHALVNLALAASALAGVVAARDRPRIAATTLALAAAGTTVLLALLGLSYFPYGSAVHPVSELLAELLVLV